MGSSHDTIKNGFFIGVKYALENGADVHVYDDLALRRSAQYGHQDVVKLLLENGANIYAKKNEALIFAKCDKIVKLLKSYMK